MMSINRSGEVTLSSSGFSPDESYNMPDYDMAMKAGRRRGNIPWI